ncbi:MAG: NifB/NifX family molybdenum-iron cluster-binding protein [Acidobacteriota bacterium]
MKLALTTSGTTPEAPLDPRFGRAPRFLVYDTDTNGFEIVDNRAGFEAAQGAGFQAAERLVRLGVDGLVTSCCGPNAFRVLERAGIEVYNSDDARTVAEAIEAYRAGRLVAVEPS